MRLRALSYMLTYCAEQRLTGTPAAVCRPSDKYTGKPRNLGILLLDRFFSGAAFGDSALCGARPGALPLDPAAFEKAGETFNKAKPYASMPRLVRYFLTINATLKVMASSNSRRSKPVSFLIFSNRYTKVLRWTNSFRAVSETLRLFSKNL